MGGSAHNRFHYALVHLTAFTCERARLLIVVCRFIATLASGDPCRRTGVNASEVRMPQHMHRALGQNLMLTFT